MNKTKEYLIRREPTKGNVWHPLPKDILDLVFNPILAPDLLGSLYRGKFGDWDLDHGIYVHFKSGKIHVLAAQINGLEIIKDFIATRPDEVNLNKKEETPFNREKKIRRLLEILGENIAQVIPHQYSAQSLDLLKQRHFGEGASHLFVSTQNTGYTGSIFVDSLSSFSQYHNWPRSHPSLEPKHLIYARSRFFNRFNQPLTRTGNLLKAIFNPDPELKDVAPSTVAKAKTEPLDNYIVRSNGSTNFIPAGTDTNQPPVMSISDSTVSNTASNIFNGTVTESTLDGFITTPDPNRPSSFFFPHPPYLGLAFTSPVAALRDPKILITLILLAEISQDDKSKTYYTTHYKQTPLSVIDNEELDNELFGEV